MVSIDYFPIVTSNEIPGYEILETKGFVYGLNIVNKQSQDQINTDIKPIFNGEIKKYIKIFEESRDEALKRMIDHAKQMNANAIISARFDSNNISNNMQEILAYGTAVLIEKK